ncbi:protein mgr2 [Cryptococcus deuterogattii R265]|uniref:protein mgr2 n=1 Tax=Cryptococcus deuterogattii (strain R265) TaxID=294750 RepID=UPI001938B3DB|nr:protein mgr2 [Cryptococcus deuterogattii R265]
MPPPPQHSTGGSTFDKIKMGAIMGNFTNTDFCSNRAGPGPRGVVATLSQYMLSSAATFGFFMSVGSVIRTESEHKYILPPMANRAASEPWRMAWKRAEERRRAEASQ